MSYANGNAILRNDQREKITLKGFRWLSTQAGAILQGKERGKHPQGGDKARGPPFDTTRESKTESLRLPSCVKRSAGFQLLDFSSDYWVQT